MHAGFRSCLSFACIALLMFLAPAKLDATIRSGSFTEKTLHTFQGGLHDGTWPDTGLVADSSGAFYGATQRGGIDCQGYTEGCGTIFKLTPQGTGYKETILFRFKGGKTGSSPSGPVLDAAGSLYGIVGFGAGPCGCGAVYKLTPNGRNYTESTVYEFTGGTNGAGPRGALAIDATGALYGTTYSGGVSRCPESNYGCGVVFKLTPNASGYTESVLYAFQGGEDGAIPGNETLAIDASGAIFGTTNYGGGTKENGTAFELVPVSGGYQEKVIYRFLGRADGFLPQGGVIEDRKGVLYGVTQYGGYGGCISYGGCGTAYQLRPMRGQFQERIMYAFKGQYDGQFPTVGLTFGPGRVLYGVAAGAVFSLTPHPPAGSFQEQVLYQFQYQIGANPMQLLRQGTDIFGVTQFGGVGGSNCPSEGCGTVFELSP